MKTQIKLVLVLIAISVIHGCSGKPAKTIINLKYAFNGESTASAKYTAFAEKARAEGFDEISVMFTAISKAEAIHAQNHRKVLEKLGEKIDKPEIGAFQVLTTAENLADAGAGESGEIDVMYPGFIAGAKEEKSTDAVKSFTWALDTEKKHREFFKTALGELNAGMAKMIPSQWLICPVCGNTFNISAVTSSCPFCMTTKEKFISA